MRTTRFLVSMFASALLSLAAFPAAAQQPAPPGAPAAPAPSKEAEDEAKIRYQRAQQLYADGDFKLALIEINRAYELAPNWKALFNIGQINYQLGNYAAARRAFERYLKEGGAEIDAKRKADIEKDLANLKARTALVTVTTDIEGADIYLDGQIIAKSPVTEPLLVDSGQHTIEARKQGRITSSRSVTLAGADEIKIEFELPEEPVPVAPTVIAPIRETIIQGESPSYTWVGWLISGTLLAGATATGIVTLSLSGDLDTARNEPLGENESIEQKRADLDAKQSRARATAITTDVLGGAAIIAAGVTLIFTIMDLTGDDKKEPADEKKASVSVRVVGGPASIGVLGQF